MKPKKKLISCGPIRGNNLSPAAYRRATRAMKNLKDDSALAKRAEAALVAFARGLLESRDQAKAQSKLIRSKKRPAANRRLWKKLTERTTIFAGAAREPCR